MQCRRLFPATRLQPTCDTLINAIDSRVPGWSTSYYTRSESRYLIPLYIVHLNHCIFKIFHVTLHYVIIILLLVSLFQCTQAEEVYQELLKNKSKLEHDIKSKALALFIDSELCMESRRWFPVSNKLQPDCQLFNSFLSDKLDTIKKKRWLQCSRLNFTKLQSPLHSESDD